MAIEESVALQPCKKCGQEYEAHRFKVLGSLIDLRGGLCPVCLAAARKRDEDQLVLEREEVRKRWRHECGIGPKFSRVGFKDYDISWAKAANNFGMARARCEEYAYGFPIDYRGYLKSGGEPYKSLLLCSPGTQGVGKTHLVNSICHAVIDRWHGEVATCPVRILSEAELYHSIEETYRNAQHATAPKEADIIKQLVWVPLLVIDDVGTETRSKKDFSNRILFAIVNGRYENNRPVVMTTNLSQEELNRYLADADGRVRIMDRLIEMCGGSVFQVKGPSHRGQ